MTFLYLIIGCVIIFFLFKKLQSKEIEGKTVYKKTLSEKKVDGIGKISVVEKLVDVSPIKQANAKEIIKKFKKPYTIEHRIIMKAPISFIYFVNFFDSRVRYGEVKATYIPLNDHYRKYYEQAHDFGLALRGNEIPTAEILSSLRLKKELNQISDKQFTRIKPAIEYLLQLPDIDLLLDRFSPRENYFQLKSINLDMDFLHEKWKVIDKT